MSISLMSWWLQRSREREMDEAWVRYRKFREKDGLDKIVGEKAW